MASLPLSVRVALWASAAYAGRTAIEDVPTSSGPDLDAMEGLLEPLRTWRTFGERVVLVALPRPGDISGLPAGSPEFVDAALEAQECVIAPSLGTAAVPSLTTFGPPGDEGWRCDWTTFDVASVPTHRVEALDVRDVERTLRADLLALTDVLADSPGVPWHPEELVGRARVALDDDLGLPPDLDARALRVIARGADVLTLSDLGLEAGTSEGLHSSATGRRETALRSLGSLASRALTDATNIAALQTAGLRGPARAR